MGQPCADGSSASFGRGSLRCPQENPRGTTWEWAAGCAKDGENTLRNELYHGLLLGMEVTVTGLSSLCLVTEIPAGICRLSDNCLFPFPFQRDQPLCHSQAAPHSHQRPLGTHHPMRRAVGTEEFQQRRRRRSDTAVTSSWAPT